MSIIDIFFTIVGIIIIIGVVIGLLRIVSERFFSYYGGLGATIVVYVVNTVEFCFLAWAFNLITTWLGISSIVNIDWGLGLILGPLYATYCWITKQRNRGMSLFRND